MIMNRQCLTLSFPDYMLTKETDHPYTLLIQNPTHFIVREINIPNMAISILSESPDVIYLESIVEIENEAYFLSTRFVLSELAIRRDVYHLDGDRLHYVNQSLVQPWVKPYLDEHIRYFTEVSKYRLWCVTKNVRVY